MTDVHASHLAVLMRRVGRGDQQAFAEVYDALSPMVHGTALRVVRDPDLSAEITQEVMIDVWRHAPDFDEDRGSVPAWVATIAHRRAIDRVRAVSSQRARDEFVGVRDQQVPFDAVSQHVEDDDERRRVRRCLDTLTDLQRQAIDRAYYGGRTYRQVAAETGVALPTIKSRMRDGLMALKRCLEVGS
nr:ECF RNA polymerase sigma factor SigK [Pseudactinotalea sp. HY160]